MVEEKPERVLKHWIEQEEIAEAMLQIIGHLSRDSKVMMKHYGCVLVGKGPVDRIRAHKYARLVTGTALTVLSLRLARETPADVAWQ